MKKFVFLVGVCMVFLGDCLAGYSDEGEWAARRDLYSRLANDSTLLSDSLMNVFWEEMENSGESGFEDVRNETDNLYQLSPVNQEQLDILNGIIAVYRDSLSVLDSLLQSTQDTVNLSTIRLLKKEIAETDSLIQSVHTGLAALRSNTLAYLETENGLLPNDSVYKANERSINTLYYNSIALGRSVFTPTEQESIDEIAFQCPLAGGKGVYLARSLRVFYESSTYYNDGQQCAEVGIQYRKKEEKDMRSAFAVYPNPTDQTLTVIQNGEISGTGEITIVDMIGRIMTEATMTDGTVSKTLEVGGIPSGVYIVFVRKGEHQYSERIIIQH